MPENTSCEAYKNFTLSRRRPWGGPGANMVMRCSARATGLPSWLVLFCWAQCGWLLRGSKLKATFSSCAVPAFLTGEERERERPLLPAPSWAWDALAGDACSLMH